MVFILNTKYKSIHRGHIPNYSGFLPNAKIHYGEKEKGKQKEISYLSWLEEKERNNI